MSGNQELSIRKILTEMYNKLLDIESVLGWLHFSFINCSSIKKFNSEHSITIQKASRMISDIKKCLPNIENIQKYLCIYTEISNLPLIEGKYEYHDMSIKCKSIRVQITVFLNTNRQC